MPFQIEIRNAEVIERWGIVRAHQRGSMGAHSHRVAIYADQVANILKWNTDREGLLRYALWHDMGEVFLSDMPGPVKRAVTDKDDYDEVEQAYMHLAFTEDKWRCPSLGGTQIKAIVKMADLIDEVLWCTVEMRMGNGMIKPVLDDATTRMTRHLMTMSSFFGTEELKTLADALKKAVDNHCTGHPKIITG